MKETPYSNIEKTFLKAALAERKRLDGRQFDERRPLSINFGKEYGCCHVSLGETRVLAQVSSEIQAPKATRPNEGQIFVNVELSPMSAEHVEAGKPSEECVEVTRVLEKCLRESKCVDLESLCIIAEDKVWTLRVDITVLNLEGNIIECASIAALSALAHFRRPDVTSTGEGIVIHDASEKEPIQTCLHHYPICLTYAIFNKGKHIIADPNLMEEQTAEARLNIGMNAYRELCGMHLGGQAVNDYKSILQVVQKAGASANEIVQFIKNALVEDSEARARKEVIGLTACIRAGRVTTLSDQRIKIRMNSKSIQETAEKLIAQRMLNRHTKWDEDGNEVEVDLSEKIVVSLGENLAELKDASGDQMEESSGEDDEEKNGSSHENVEEPVVEEKPKVSPKQKKKTKQKKSPQKYQEIILSDDSDSDDLEVVQELTKEEKERMKNVETLVLDDSEEEETATLTTKEMETPSNSKTSPNSMKNNLKRKRKEKKKGKRDNSNSREWYSKSSW